MFLCMPTQRDWRPKISNYVEGVVSEFSEADMLRTFRLSETGMNILLGLVKAALKNRPKTYVRGRPAVDLRKQVLILLYYLCTQSTEYQIAQIFGISDSTVYKCIARLIDILYEDCQSALIRWPAGDRMLQVVQAFKGKRDISGIIGAIDGSHIAINCPDENACDYVNRKGFHSVVLQAVCDSDLYFTDVYVGWPGSVHDARVYRNSPLCESLETDPERLCPNGLFLLGDAAYPLTCQLMTPIKDTGSLTNSDTYHNFCHSSSRMVIERAFGLLKGRFRRLKFVNVVDAQKRVRLIVVACMLHNVCLLAQSGSEQIAHDNETMISEGAEMAIDSAIDTAIATGHSSDATKLKRRHIITSLSGQ